MTGCCSFVAPTISVRSCYFLGLAIARVAMVVFELMQVGAPAILSYVVVCLNRCTKLVRGKAGWHCCYI